MPRSRRNLLALLSMVALGIGGCSNQGDESGDDDNFGQLENNQEQVCTEAYVSNFEWDGHFFGEDEFHGTLVNQGNIAGTVTVELRFWESDSENTLEGSVRRSFSIAAQDTRDITIEATPPTDESQWGDMVVGEQDCRFQ